MAAISRSRPSSTCGLYSQGAAPGTRNRGGDLGEAATADRVAQGGHQPLEIGEVVDGEQPLRGLLGAP